MRTIKFRAWHREDSEMVDNQELAFAKWDYLTSACHLILMQFTGLLDKNGKEIYEGDILEYEDEGQITDSFIEPVIWIDNQYNVGFGTSSSENVWGEVARLSEIIGNIYSDPELLNNK